MSARRRTVTKTARPQRPKRRHDRWANPYDATRRAKQVSNALAGTCVQRRRLVPGIVVWAWVPYEDSLDGKWRMAVVIASPTGDTLKVVPLTTLRSCGMTATTPIEDWDAIGASRPLGAKFQVIDIDPRLCSKIEGVLTGGDWRRVADIATRLGAKTAVAAGV